MQLNYIVYLLFLRAQVTVLAVKFEQFIFYCNFPSDYVSDDVTTFPTRFVDQSVFLKWTGKIGRKSF